MVVVEMEDFICEIWKKGDMMGGCIFCLIIGLLVGLGELVFDKFYVELGKVMFFINVVKGVEFGLGFVVVVMFGLEYNDIFKKGGVIVSNYFGGI